MASTSARLSSPADVTNVPRGRAGAGKAKTPDPGVFAQGGKTDSAYWVGNQPSPEGVQGWAGACAGISGVIGAFFGAFFRATVCLRAAGFFRAAFLWEALPRVAFFLAGALRFRAFLATLCPPLIECMTPPLSPISRRCTPGPAQDPRRMRESEEPAGVGPAGSIGCAVAYFLIPKAAYWSGM